MKHYILRFLLIFACVSIPLHSNACWDDDWDDFYSYDDYDDYDDWWDDDDDYDDWWDDYDDDWWNDNVDYGDIGNDDYDIDGGELDDVVVTPDDDWDDDDWWRVDYSYEEEDNDDDDWYNDYDDDSNNNNYCSIKGDNDSDKKKYTLKSTDKLSVDIKKLNKQRGFKQGTCNTCVCAGMEFVAKLFGNNSLTEGDVLLSLSWLEGSNVIIGIFDTKNIACDLANIANNAGLKSDSYVTDIKNAIDNGEVVMTTIPVESDDNHDVVIVGYNDDGYIAYDTDKKTGDYIIVSDEDINSLYKVGIKKK